MSVGIDDIAVYVPGLFLDLKKEFEEKHRIIDSKPLKEGHIVKGIGSDCMAVADANQDAATLAASAVLKLIQNSQIKPDEIDNILIGTESGVDESKAMGCYVIGMLEKVLGEGTLEECGTVEFKEACIATTYALDFATSCVASGDNQGKKEIVVASDIARYDMHSAGEYTQGAGAVAMLVTEDPRLIAFERRIKAKFTRDENDFFRPTGRDTAVVYGKHSNDCYLNAMKAVMERYKKRVVERGLIVPSEGETVTDYFDYLNFHLPYPRMAEYAAAFLFRHEWRDLPRWKDMIADIGGEEPKRTDYEDITKFIEADTEFRKKFVKHPVFQKVYKEKVEPSIVLSRQIGNIYTGSLYLGLASTLEVEHKRGVNLAGKRFGFGSYGSGLSAMAFSGIIRPGYKKVVSQFNMIEELAARKEIGLDVYETLHKRELKEPVLKEPGFVLVEIMSDGYRKYDYQKG